jgi:DEAD/DEAH box helicase domain-containing protein
MIDHVVVDVEIQKTIEETPGGWEATDKLGVAVACLWEHKTERMRVYGPDDVPALKERLLKADRISGYNIWKFDFPVIWGLPNRGRVDELRSKTNDLLLRIWSALGLNLETFTGAHKGWGLDVVAGSTLNARKIGYGGDAPKWYQAGLIQKVVNYCSDDVALERDLAEFIDKYGYVLNDVKGSLKKVEILPWKTT